MAWHRKELRDCRPFVAGARRSSTGAVVAYGSVYLGVRDREIPAGSLPIQRGLLDDRLRRLEGSGVTYIFPLLVYLAVTAIMCVPVLGAWFATRRMRDSRRSLLLVVVATLLLAPSWGPTTIVVVPVPFGILFISTLLTWSWGELARWVAMFPLWHAIAFPVTACLCFLLIRKLLLGHASEGASAAV